MAFQAAEEMKARVSREAGRSEVVEVVVPFQPFLFFLWLSIASLRHKAAEGVRSRPHEFRASN